MVVVWSALQAKTLVGVSAGEGPAFSHNCTRDCHSPRYSHQVKVCKTKNMSPPKNQIKSTTCRRCRSVVEQSHLFNQRMVANVCGGKDDRGT